MAALNLSKKASRGVLGSRAEMGGASSLSTGLKSVAVGGEIGVISSSLPRGMKGVDLGTAAGLRIG